MSVTGDLSAAANQDPAPGDVAYAPQQGPEAATWKQEQAVVPPSRKRQDGAHSSNIGDPAADLDLASAASTLAQAGSEYRVLTSSTDSGSQEHHTVTGQSAEPHSMNESTGGAESDHENQRSHVKQRRRLNSMANKGAEADLVPTGDNLHFHSTATRKVKLPQQEL
ncbi:uncharacterized protein LOC144134124 [Amblyomma americanum]